jgi:hypothetical protein
MNVDSDPSKRKADSVLPPSQDADPPITPKKQRATIVPLSPLPTRTVGYYLFIDCRPTPFNRQLYNKTGAKSISSYAFNCHANMLALFPASPLESEKGKHQHMTLSAMENAFKHILVNNSVSTVLLFLLNAQAMDITIIPPNHGTLLKAKIIRAAHALKQQHYCVKHGKGISGYVSNSTAAEWTPCSPPIIEPPDESIEIDSSDEDTMEESCEKEDIVASAKVMKDVALQQKLADEQEAAEKQRLVKENNWVIAEDATGAANEKEKQTDLTTTTKENKKNETQKKDTRQHRKKDEQNDKEEPHDNLSTASPTQKSATTLDTRTRTQRISAFRSESILKANQAHNSGIQFKFWDSPKIIPTNLAWAKKHRMPKTDLAFHQCPPFTEHDPTKLKVDKTKDRLCLHTTLEETIPKEWELFGHMVPYDDSTVTKDVYAKFIQHVYTKQGPSKQPSQQKAKWTFLRFTRTSPEFFDRWRQRYGYYLRLQIC